MVARAGKPGSRVATTTSRSLRLVGRDPLTMDNSKTERELVVDGEFFRLTIDGPSYQLTWLSGPNRNYGFGGTLAGGGSVAERSALLAAQLTDEGVIAQIRGFLLEVDPATGYLRD